MTFNTFLLYYIRLYKKQRIGEVYNVSALSPTLRISCKDYKI